MTAAVTKARIATARKHLANVEAAAVACREANLPFFVACALLEKESVGRNVYGHDAGSINSAPGELEVTDVNFLQFLVKVLNGATPNGVGPCQVTYAGALVGGHRDGGYFRQMIEQGLRPWVPEENMRFGFALLKRHYDATGSWRDAGSRYNGSPVYGAELEARIAVWKKRLGI